MLRFHVFFLFMLVSIGFAQQDELYYIKGKVLAETEDVTSVTITNKRSTTTTNPDEKGNFSLFVKVNDELTFDGLSVDSKTITITRNELNKKIVAVTLHPKVVPLNEVTIKKYPEINAVSLGILQKEPKKYTPAERRLETAGDFKWYYPLLIPLGGMPMDGLVNLLSGRTKLLEKEVQIERRELALKALANDFDPNYFTDRLHIPAEKVPAFHHYSVENDSLRSLLQSKDRIKTEFQLAQLATRFLKIQEDEKQ